MFLARCINPTRQMNVFSVSMEKIHLIRSRNDEITQLNIDFTNFRF